MKKLILFIAILFIGIRGIQAQHLKKDGTPDMRYKENKTSYQSSPSNSNTNPNIVPVREYTKSNGTVVPAHDRTAPNNTNRDNWDTKPNTNPETGKKGTKEPDNN